MISIDSNTDYYLAQIKGKYIRAQKANKLGQTNTPGTSAKPNDDDLALDSTRGCGGCVVASQRLCLCRRLATKLRE
jgi:hypothetical protein